MALHLFAECVSDDTRVPVRIATPEEVCSEHADTPALVVEIPEPSDTPSFGTAFCQGCLSDLDWVLRGRVTAGA